MTKPAANHLATVAMLTTVVSFVAGIVASAHGRPTLATWLWAPCLAILSALALWSLWDLIRNTWNDGI